ncbi:MAG: GAF domain-containing protein, partial [Bacteroidales bacterium]|nr:GAF domain-containing protein [Bacteroidales bacterium]
MAEELIITAKDKGGIYAQILPQIEAVVSAETDMIANMANVSAILKEAFGFWWVGFYIVKPTGGSDTLHVEEELVLGPFQGPLACTRIKKGRGVCGTAWAEKSTVIVPDVNQFPGHIACSSLSRSEIVVPVFASDG